MTIVDTHCHVSRSWYEPAEALLHQMDRYGVARAVLVQIHGQYDNSYQFEVAGRHPDRLVTVVNVDSGRPDALDALERLVDRGARGVRFRPQTRSLGDDPLAIWRKAAELDLPVTCGGDPGLGSEEFARVVEALPDLPIVLEHLGSANHPDGEQPPYPSRSRVFALARFPNVYIKFHGLGEFCTRNIPVTEPFPFEGRVEPILDMALAAFGPERMMWGSDYPPVSAREGYGNALRLPMEHLKGQGKEKLGEMFGAVALRLYWEES